MKTKTAPFMNVAATLRDEILSSRAAGDRLPSIHELAKRFSVSTLTIGQAITVLAERGLVTRKRGSGIYVVDASRRGQHVGILLDQDFSYPTASYFHRRVAQQLRRIIGANGFPTRLYAGFHEPTDAYRTLFGKIVVTIL